MEKQNPVYIKLEYSNALISQKDLLSSEIFFLNLTTIRKKLNLLKMQEIIIKTKISRELKRIKISAQKMGDLFPKVNILKRRHIETGEISDASPEKRADDRLDIQLKEIQEKLRALSSS
jgi:hypothetical protein